MTVSRNSIRAARRIADFFRRNTTISERGSDHGCNFPNSGWRRLRRGSGCSLRFVNWLMCRRFEALSQVEVRNGGSLQPLRAASCAVLPVPLCVSHKPRLRSGMPGRFAYRLAWPIRLRTKPNRYTRVVYTEAAPRLRSTSRDKPIRPDPRNRRMPGSELSGRPAAKVRTLDAALRSADATLASTKARSP